MFKHRSIRGRTLLAVSSILFTAFVFVKFVFHGHGETGGVEVRHSVPRHLDSGAGDVLDSGARGALESRPGNGSAEMWANHRQALLKAEGPVKVFLLSYMRGGSSTAGEIFNQDPRALMWYEPGAAYYTAYHGLVEENFPQHDLYFSNMTRRSSSDLEHKWLTYYYTRLLTCQYRSLPPEALAHYFTTMSKGLSDYTSCMDNNIVKDYTLNRCVRLVTPICGTTAQSSLQQKCHLIMESTRIVFQEHPELAQALVGATSDLFHFSQGTEQMVALLSDHMSRVGYFTPLALGSLKWFVQHRVCVEQVGLKVAACLEKASTACDQKEIQAVQVNRLNMEDLAPLIEANPDLYVLHFVRDPRAIALSRVQTDHLVWDLTNKTPQTEARLLCRQMSDDLMWRRELEKRYPGVFMQAKYEDLVTDPAAVARDVYSWIGREPSSEWLQYAQSSMHGQHDQRPYGHELKDAVANSDRWTRDLTRSQIDDIQAFCGQLLRSLGYQIIE